MLLTTSSVVRKKELHKMGNKMKRVLKAFDDKDFGSLTSLIACRCLDPNRLIPDKGVTWFHLIIGHQSENFAFKVTKLFLRCGGDPNVASEDGVTPIHVAAAWGRTRILHLLLVNGGDPWIQDDDRKNAFNYAFEEQEWDAVEMLHHFQQVHSSDLSRRNFEQNPMFELNFERILLRKGDEMFEYALAKDNNKNSNSNSRVEGELQKERVISPVLNKIKYFESHPCNSDVSAKATEKSHRKCPKNHYQTSCEFAVNIDEIKPRNETDAAASGDEEEKQNHFISSIHIDASPLKTEELASKDSIIFKHKPSNDSKCEDVRSLLFTELQEAVLRRSRLKTNGHDDDVENEYENEKGISEPKERYSEPSIIEWNSNSNPSIVSVPNEATEKNSMVEDNLATKVSYLYGVNLSSNSLLKHMSDFATKVMEEMETCEAEDKEKRSASNVEMTSTYLTCEDESDSGDDEGKVVEAIAISGDNPGNPSVLDTSNESFLSVAEEYKYTDAEEGVVLLEKKLMATPTFSELMLEDVGVECDGSSIFSDVSSVSSVPSAISYASDTLRTELTSFGFNPGPITRTTKKLYLRKLWRLKKVNRRVSNAKQAYSVELERTLKNEIHFKRILLHVKLEEEMIRTFDENPKRKWREGGSKTSFNYLLLDPRVSLNLPRRAAAMPDTDVWQCFLSSIFYVGKGKRARPYAHLYEAASWWHKNGGNKTKPNEKVKHITDIWSEGLGVICVHAFQNIIAVEAYTREAAMIDAIRVANLKNAKSGDYYGSPATWIARDKLKLGVLLLYKAMLIYLSEGERQIRPFDIG